MNIRAAYLLILIAFSACSRNVEARAPRVSVQKQIAKKVQLEDTVETDEVLISFEDTVEQDIDTLGILHQMVYDKFDGAEMENVVFGDLDADGDSDALVVIERTCGEYDGVSDDSRCYRLLLFTADDSSNFSLVLVNETILECSDCQRSEPRLKVESGMIQIEKTYGACWKDIITESYFFDGIDSWYLRTIEKQSVNCNAELVNGEIPIITHPVSTEKEFGKIKL